MKCITLIMYDINEYTDKQLYDILDMNNPTDRELEAKIIHMINKYENMQNDAGNKLMQFFIDIYNHFFDVKEGMTEGMTEGRQGRKGREGKERKERKGKE